MAGRDRGRQAKRRVRHDGWTGEARRGFLDALGECGNVRDACRRAGMSNTSAYRVRRIDPEFGAAWDAALKRAAVSLEAIAFQRATEGAEEIVIRDGREVSRRRKPSDTILRLILQASNPAKYGRTGGQMAVAAREEIEARERAAEERGYRAAWAALLAEYRFQCEPVYARHWLWRQLHVMHARMCGNAWCRDCHPERVWPAFDGGRDTTPPEDHRPVPPARDWMGPAWDIIDSKRRSADPEAPLVDRDAPPPETPDALERWFDEVTEALLAEQAAANRAGRALELGPRPQAREMAPPVRSVGGGPDRARGQDQ